MLRDSSSGPPREARPVCIIVSVSKGNMNKAVHSHSLLYVLLAGLAIACRLGYLDEIEFLKQRESQLTSMIGLRSGSHGDARGKAKQYLNDTMKAHA